MNKILKMGVLLMTTLGIVLGSAACVKTEDEGVKRTVEAGAVALPEEIGALSDAAAYKAFADHGISPESDQEGYGVAVSADYTMQAGGETVPVYCTPMYLPLDVNNPIGDLHHFATISVEEGGFPLQVEIKVAEGVAFEGAVVLPQRHNVTASASSGTISMQLNGYGNYTVSLDGQPLRPLTIFVQKAVQEESFPDGMTVLRYPKGFHFVETIELKSNMVLYLESGAYLYALPASPIETPTVEVDTEGKTRWNPLISGNFLDNVQIIGDGAYLDCTGLDWHARDPINIKNCTNTVIQGITLINAPMWNITAMYCKDLVIDSVKIFGYRTNSDGIEIANCENVTVRNCFIRSGDDLYGVKSMNSGMIGGRNILFENNVAWPDKVRGFGVLHETQSDISDVTFRGCSVLFRCHTWMDDLASLAIVVGDSGTISDILFEDIEIYYDVKYPILLSFKKDEYSSSSEFGRIENVTFRNIRYNSTADTAVRMNAVQEENTDRIKNIKFENIYKDGEKVTDLAGLNLNLTYVLESNLSIS